MLFLCCGLMAQEYFQQELEYRIDVRLDPNEHRLSAELELIYRNNSPDTLQFIYFHLWPNAYSTPDSPLGEQLYGQGNGSLQFAEEAELGGISGLAWTVDGSEAQFEFDCLSPDYGKLHLTRPLPPSGQMLIKTPFEVKIPSSDISRLGHEGTSYQITQWYPKPAVYDSKGWHPMPYLHMGEFYSEFGSFQVDITVPSEYTLGATGILQDESEKERMMQLARGETPDLSSSEGGTKTLRYTQGGVHDFAWFADPEFRIKHDSLLLPKSGQIVDMWVLYTPESESQWKNSMDYAKGGIHHYSNHLGEYPYGQMTVVDGRLSAGGGMEYPMITVINSETGGESALEQVIVHEIGHNWFYGLLASNERDHPWMDEGMNSYYEELYFQERYGYQMDKGVGAFFGLRRYDLQRLAYLFNARRHLDIPLESSSAQFDQLNYGLIVYAKGSLLLAQLREELGDELFEEAMREYYRSWAYKHPYPEDFIRVMEAVGGKPLDSFFQFFLRSDEEMDIRVHGERVEDGSLNLISDAHPLSTVELKLQSLGDTTYRRSVVVAGDFPGSLDIDSRNNEFRTQGLLRSWQRPDLAWIGGIGLNPRPTLGLAPLVAWNHHDKHLLGAYISNAELLRKDFEWQLSPLFSPSSEEFAGMASLDQRFWLPSNAFLELGMNYRRFGLGSQEDMYFGYERIKPHVILGLPMPEGRKGHRELELSMEQIRLFGDIDGLNRSMEHERYISLTYQERYDFGLHSQGFILDGEWNEDFLKLGGEFNHSQEYDSRGHMWTVRLHASKMWLYDSFEDQWNLAARPNLRGTDASQDYLYRYLLLARGVGSGDEFLAQQWVRDRGGFVSATAFGSSDDWVASLGVTFDAPIPVPLTFFGNLGFYETGNDAEGVNGLYEAGLTLRIIRNRVDLSAPLVYHDDIRGYFEDFDVNFGQRIRFQYRIEAMEPRNMRDRFDL